MERQTKIFLGGGGNETLSASFDDEFFKYLKGNLAYIPIAMTSRPYSECFTWFNRVVNGRSNVNMWTDLNKITMQDLQAIGGIYIGGGNTNRLMDHFLETGFTSLISRYIREGGLIYGGSAGAIILGKDLRTAPEVRNNARLSYDGLNFLDGLSVFCHYKGLSEENQLIMDLSPTIESPILAIPETGGVIRCKDNLIVIGERAKLFYPDNSIKTLAPTIS